jgi:trigger factor
MLAPVEEDRPAQIGDVVVVDYKSFVGDKPLEGGVTDNLDIELGKGQAHQEIELALVKARIGDQVQVQVTYDENSPNEQVRGKTVHFEMTVKGLKKKILPEPDDDFARAVSPEFNSLTALKERIAKELVESYQQQKDQALRGQILDQLRELVKFDLPVSLVAAEVENMVNNFRNRLRHSGMDPDQAGLDSAKLGEGFKDDAEKKVRAGIVLGRVAEVESVDVSQNDLDAELGRLAEHMGQPRGVIHDMYIKNNRMPTLSARLLEEKTLKIIKDAAVIEQVDPEKLAKDTQQIGSEPI